MSEQLISKHTTNKWIPGSPVQIKELSLVLSDEKVLLSITAVPCTDREISHYIADVRYYNSRRELIGTHRAEDLPLSAKIDALYPNAAFAEATVCAVTYSSGETWTSADECEEITLPEQEIIWQTDPLYKVIKAVTQGKVNAKYYPDIVEGGWRCACGQVNIDTSNKCGACDCSRDWLTDVFNREYLESQKQTVEEGKKPEKAERIKKREAEKLIPDSVKMILIFASALLVIGAVLFATLYIVPENKLSDAIKLADNGEYEKAIEQLTELEDYKNSKELVERYTYESFVLKTGIEDLYITTTEKEPWFEISEDGSLVFISSKYTGTYEDFKIPHVVNKTVVKKLSKNFCINCTELEAVVIPDTVEVVGDQAFFGCKSLKSVVFGKNVHTIEQRAFIECEALETVLIPKNVKSLGQRAFNGCTALKTVILGDGISEIGYYTFSNCSSLESVTISSPLSKIGDYAFINCTSLKEISCAFSKDEWIEPNIGVGNDILSEIEIKYIQ